MIKLARLLQHIRDIVKDGLFRRIFKNTALLTSGKLISALLGLGYLSLAAHALGAYKLGVLIIIHTYIIIVRNTLAFNSWQALIRYGARLLAKDRRDDMQKLVIFTLLLDITGAVFATIIGVSAAATVAPWFKLPADTLPLVTLYSLVILFNIKSAPLGLLRLFDRFDLLALQSLAVPIVRFTGVIIAYYSHAGLWAYLLTWFLATLVSSLLLLLFGWQEFHRQGLATGLSVKIPRFTAAHSGIWSFVWISNIQSTLNLIEAHISTMIVGFIIGPAGAGLFKIAHESASILTKPSQLVAQTIYPELARLAKSHDNTHLWQIIIKSGVIALAVAAVVLCIIVLTGKTLLVLIFGIEFIDAYSVLLLLMLAGAVTLATFSLEPAMYAVGRPDIPLRIKIISSLIHVAATFFFLQTFGLTGAGVATVLSGALTATLMLLFAVRLFTLSGTARP